MAKKEGLQVLAEAAAKQVGRFYKKIEIVNLKPDKIAIVLLKLPTEEAIEMLKAVHLADNIRGSQIEGVQKKLSHSKNKKARPLLKAIKTIKSV